MVPLLINGRDMIKYGIISVLTAVFIFTGGVFYGYNSASSFYMAGSASEPLLLPVKAAIADQVRAPKVPETIVAGAEIDVDQPDSASKDHDVVVNKAGAAQGKNTKAVITEQATNNTGQDIVVAVVDSKDFDSVGRDVDVTENEVVSVQIKQEQIQADNHRSDKSADPRINPKTIDISTLTPDELNSIKYSVQVGMYGSLANAENMMKQLHTKDFDAYVSDFTNKKNETRYNVRFGYFHDKRTATLALKQYRQSQQADGYLVKFTADSLTSQGSNSLVKNRQPDSYELNNNDPDANKNKPSAEEIKSADDKLSRLDSLNIENMINSRGKLDQMITVTN